MFIENSTMAITGNIRLALYSEDNLLNVFVPDDTIYIQRCYEANINLPKLELRKEMCICPPTEGAKIAYLNGTCLEIVAYSSVLNQLFVTFRASGDVYRYFDVPASEFLNLQIAESAGKYYNSDIKGKYKGEYFC